MYETLHKATGVNEVNNGLKSLSSPNVCNPRIPAHSSLIDAHQLGKVVPYQMQRSALLWTPPRHVRGHWAACAAPTRRLHPSTCASVARLRGGEPAGSTAPSCMPIDGRVGSLTGVKGDREAAQSNSVWMTLPRCGGKWRYPLLHCAPGTFKLCRQRVPMYWRLHGGDTHRIEGHGGTAQHCIAALGRHRIWVDAVVQRKNGCRWNGCHWAAVKKGGLPSAQVVGLSESLPPVAPPYSRPLPSQTDEGQTPQSGLASVDAGDHRGVPEVERG
ncbi:hypothetical protein DFH08DRAFT_809154 [Mycena albidolilacea]|uniref:Uncharacterized protein n=1 Tax=Mycena albidolilacea TaxID=1033008 RepID=A0AAD7EQK1_9AGAR|nr:hypothetical protein DFH08DRAFT_809154 [Mycena albidolilacea]